MPFAPEPFTIGRTAAAWRIAASPAAVDASVPLGIIAIGGLIAWLCQNLLRFPAGVGTMGFLLAGVPGGSTGRMVVRARRGADPGNGAASIR